MASGSFVLKGDICHSRGPAEFETASAGFVVCVDGVSRGVFQTLPEEYRDLPVEDCGDCVVVPGLTDLHVHAPQFAFRGLGMDLELLDWLNTRTFPEEAKYGDLDYARRAYDAFVSDVRRGPNTRAVVFATRHVPATLLLMDMLEESGLVTMVGKVNMDRNSPPDLQEESAERSAEDTLAWLSSVAQKKYSNTRPILTPRFIPSCTDDLMARLSEIQAAHDLPVQSHLSENITEVEWVRELCPGTECYADAYHRFGLLRTATVMAHCVHSYLYREEVRLLRESGAHVAHCPQSNTNLSSGIAPIRKFLNDGVKVGLGSDVAGGSDTSILRVMRHAIEVSKLHWRLVDQRDRPLTLEEAFWLGTAGSGSFFGNVGTFAPGAEFDAVVFDDTGLRAPYELTIPERVARVVYYADDRHIAAKYARGRPLLLA